MRDFATLQQQRRLAELDAMSNRPWHRVEQPRHAQRAENRFGDAPASRVPAGARILRPIDEAEEGARHAPHAEAVALRLAELHAQAPAPCLAVRPEPEPTPARDPALRLTAWRRPGVRKEVKPKRFKRFTGDKSRLA